MPLSESLQEVGQRVADFHDGVSSAPFLIYQYEPRDEYVVRRELNDLRNWLSAKHQIGCQSISLAEILWEMLEENGQLEMIIEAEQAGQYEDAQLTVRQILASPPTLADRIVERVIERGDEREAIFLYRAGALYPAHRTSPLLDALKDRVDRPVTLLYPGRVVGDYGLSFMNKAEPAYGYRALIIPREGKL